MECDDELDSDLMDSDGDEGIYEGDDDIALEPIDRQQAAAADYIVLSQDEIAENMVQSIQEVNEIFQIDAQSARGLLVHFRWDKERLLERYYDGDPEKLMAEAHITIRTTYAAQASSPQCGVCFLDVPSSDMVFLQCGHGFCSSCWRTYLSEQIMNLGVSQHITCAGYDCGVLMDELTVSKLITNSSVKSRYNYLMAKQFVEANRLFQWCPNADCTNAVKCPEREPRPVRCACGHVFCFWCLEPSHQPVVCEYLRRWMKKREDGSETNHWIHANTKPCPQCNAVIEKSGGCNHMVCRNQACKMEFCWVCSGPWAPHGSSWYNCNRFDPKKVEEDRDSTNNARAVLTRYIFYLDRYLNHLRSHRLEIKLSDQVKMKAEELQHHGLTWMESQFLPAAVEVLAQCRSVLMNSYVFAYYLKSNNQVEIFLANQKDFELSTEALSGYLEHDISVANAAELKAQCQDKMEYCKSRRQKLLDHVNEGYDKDWWEYNES